MGSVDWDDLQQTWYTPLLLLFCRRCCSSSNAGCGARGAGEANDLRDVKGLRVCRAFVGLPSVAVRSNANNYSENTAGR